MAAHGVCACSASAVVQAAARGLQAWVQGVARMYIVPGCACHVHSGGSGALEAPLQQQVLSSRKETVQGLCEWVRWVVAVGGQLRSEREQRSAAAD